MLNMSIHPTAAFVIVKSFPTINAQCVEIRTVNSYGNSLTELNIWAPTAEIAEELGAALRKVFSEPKAKEPAVDPDYEDVF